jgi:membrane protease YdiL (CAAX protease family)
LGDALGGWAVAYVVAALCSAVIVSLAGYEPDADLPLWLVALTYPPLWLGFVGIPVWAAKTKGNGWVEDFGGRIRPIDVPVGLAVGFLAQVIVVPLVSWPFLKLTGQTTEDLSESAQALADKATGPWGPLLFFVIVGLLAPIAEELFFRGLVLRSFERRIGIAWAVVASSLWFAATHFQPLQFPALLAAGAIFALLAVRTDRLGPAVVAHMAFNTTTVVVLLWL